MKPLPDLSILRIRQVALGLLYSGDLMAFQLRDDRPDIENPGVWGLFGGEIEDDETPLEGFRREIREELRISGKNPKSFGTYPRFDDAGERYTIYWIFTLDVSEDWDRHILCEGQDGRLFSRSRIRTLEMPLFIRFLIDEHGEILTNEKI